MLTARETSEDVIEALYSGVDEFLVKPINYQELRARVERGKRSIAFQHDLIDTNQKLQARLKNLEEIIMLINVTMKTPDALSENIKPVLRSKFPEMSKMELEDEYDEVFGICSKWFSGGGEYVTIQIDTKAGTAIVLPNSR